MTAAPLALAQAAVARLCHDLAGGVGTIGNALDLAIGGGEMAAEALAIAAEASRELTIRLRMARLMWGEEAASVGAVLALAEGLPARSRIRLDRSALAESMLPPPLARLLACLLLLASESLHGAGQIVFAGDPAGEMSVAIAGPRAVWSEAFVDRLAGGGAAAGPDAVNLVPYIVTMAAAAAGAALRLSGAGASPAPLLVSMPG